MLSPGLEIIFVSVDLCKRASELPCFWRHDEKNKTSKREKALLGRLLPSDHAQKKQTASRVVRMCCNKIYRQPGILITQQSVRSN